MGKSGRGLTIPCRRHYLALFVLLSHQHTSFLSDILHSFPVGASQSFVQLCTNFFLDIPQWPRQQHPSRFPGLTAIRRFLPLDISFLPMSECSAAFIQDDRCQLQKISMFLFSVAGPVFTMEGSDFLRLVIHRPSLEQYSKYPSPLPVPHLGYGRRYHHPLYQSRRLPSQTLPHHVILRPQPQRCPTHPGQLVLPQNL